MASAMKSAARLRFFERLVRRFVDQRTEGESFATWAHRADEEELT